MTIHASGYTVQKIGPHQELTPEGFLLCRDVTVARTGQMIYGPDEIKDSEGESLEPGRTDIIKVFRKPESIFNDKTIASALGKPFTLEHPESDVTPHTWKEQAHGVALHVRPGEGALDDLLLMDLLITTAEAIEAVKNNRVEISLGYDAEYEKIKEGEWEQTNIIINHIAGVEQGRCGPRCAIKDKQLTILSKEDINMATNRYSKKPANNKKGLAKVVDLLFKAHKAKDAGELKEVLDEATCMDELTEAEASVGNLDEAAPESGDTHIHIHNGKADGAGQEPFEAGTTTDDDEDPRWSAIMARLDAIEAKLSGTTDEAEPDDTEKEEEDKETMDDGEDLEEFLEEEKPEGTKAQDARKAKDSRYLGESLKNAIAAAEILAPGIRMPTYDSKARPLTTAKKICGLRKTALDTAFKRRENYPIFDSIIGNKTLDTSRMTCDAIRVLFQSAAALKRQSNNTSGARDSIADLKAASINKPKTLEEINAINAAFYASHK